MTVRFVVSDLDGTLLTREKEISQRNKEALRRLAEKKIVFGIASGRPAEAIERQLGRWGIRDAVSFIIGMNGGTFFDMKRRHKEVFYTLSKETMLEIYHHFEDMDVCFQIIEGDVRYTNRSTPQSAAYTRLCGEREIVVDLKGYLQEHAVQKFMIYCEKERMKQVVERAGRYHNPACFATQTTPNMLEYTDAHVHKGFGIKKAAEHFHFEVQEGLAFGDEANDIEMFQTVGTSVCMKNGTAEAKKHAAYVSAYTNDEDGVARFLEVLL